MSLPASTPHSDAAIRPELAWLARAGRARAALLLSGLAALIAAVLAWAGGELLQGAGAGPWAAPLAAAIGMFLVMLPLMALLLKLARQVEAGRRQLAHDATRDQLTGVPNQVHFTSLVEREWSRSRRYGSGAAVLLLDIDRFRRLCETRGVEAGQAVLREIAKQTEPTLRGADAVARYGPSQLAVFLAQADPTGALDVAERIRERTEMLEVLWGRQNLRVTVSVGVAILRPAHESPAALLADVEAAVQAARQAGGNCVRAAPVDPAQAPSPGPSVGDNRTTGRSS